MNFLQPPARTLLTERIFESFEGDSPCSAHSPVSYIGCSFHHSQVVTVGVCFRHAYHEHSENTPVTQLPARIPSHWARFCFLFSRGGARSAHVLWRCGEFRRCTADATQRLQAGAAGGCLGGEVEHPDEVLAQQVLRRNRYSARVRFCMVIVFFFRCSTCV